LYYRIYATSQYSGDYIRVAVDTLQFYGRELKVSVPIMTSNTAPYGEASASATENPSSYSPWRAFSNNANNLWVDTAADSIGRLIYRFTAPTVIKMAVFSTGGDGQTTSDGLYIQYSDDGNNWQDCSNVSTYSQNTQYNIASNADTAHLYWAIHLKNKGSWKISIKGNAQFYGLDYSEKEFESGTTKKWLYDHGLKIDDNVYRRSGNNGTNPVFGSDSVVCKAGSQSSDSFSAILLANIDVTPYVIVRGKIKDCAVSSAKIWVADTAYSTEIAAATLTATSFPYNLSLNISNVNQVGMLQYGIPSGGNGTLEITEWWLE
jgi:hypothetical protein